MTENNDILNNFKKREKPSLDKDYFSNFQNELMTSIEEDSILDQLDKREKSIVPDGYFENFADSINLDSKLRKGKVIQLIYKVSILAACLAIVFGSVYFNSQYSDNKELALSDSEELLLTYLSEEDLIDFIDVETIEIEESETLEDFLYEELEGDVYEYYNELNL